MRFYSSQKKLEDSRRNLSQMTDFSEALDESGLQDISFKGDGVTNAEVTI